MSLQNLSVLFQNVVGNHVIPPIGPKTEPHTGFLRAQMICRVPLIFFFPMTLFLLLEIGAVLKKSLLQYLLYKKQKEVCANYVQLFVVSWTVAHQAPLSMDSPGKNAGVGCHFLLQGFFPTQGSNPCLLCLLH